MPVIVSWHMVGSTNSSQLNKQMRQQKQKQRRGKRKGKRKSNDCSVSIKPLYMAHTCSPLYFFPNSLTHLAHGLHRRSPSGPHEEAVTQKDSKELPKCKQVNYRVRTKPCNTESQSPFSTLPCAVCSRKDTSRGSGNSEESPQNNSVDPKPFIE